MPMKNKGAAYFAEREGYSVRADADMETAELVLYGLVVKSRPFDYDTNKPTEENYIVESEILDDLKAISKSRKLDIKLNSCGGSYTTSYVKWLRTAHRSPAPLTVWQCQQAHTLCALLIQSGRPRGR